MFADLGFPPAEAESLKICSRLMMAAQDVIDSRGLSVADAARLFGVTQAVVRKLIRGKIREFTMDSLVKMLTHAGLHLEVTVKVAA